MRPGPPARPVLWPLILALGAAACGGGSRLDTPIPDAEDVARRVREASAVEHPTHVIFEWEYADESGSFRGDGVARVNPPDRFRLDLFSTGEGSLQATLVDGVLTTSGDLEGVDLPPIVFLYAMAGVFRPGEDAPRAGFAAPGRQAPAAGSEIPGLQLEFEAEGGTRRYFDFVDGRLTRVEERSGRRRERWIELAWGSDSVWPREARYTDEVTESGVRWELLSTRVEPQLFDEGFYVLPNQPRR
ncbi:hypothetical protein [Candidatus Palauibacter sp.]|uniref:hypothetical protein n=1 Tax=Candidatus Palauibacter sp. TaxID=3101350 RepID=UPI003AF29301